MKRFICHHYEAISRGTKLDSSQKAYVNLVIALENGYPCEERVIGNAVNRLKKKADLRDGALKRV